MQSSQLVVINAPGERWAEAEAELVEAGIPLPLRSRLAWVRSRPAARHWLLLARDAIGQARGGLVLEALRSRALPGHWILRAERVGASVTPQTEGMLFAEAIRQARADGRILRVAIELFTPDAGRRTELARALAAAGFHRIPARSYSTTLAVDLGKSEEEILASFSKKTRRDLAAVERQSLTVRPIVDSAYALRLDELLRLTMARTGGLYRPEDWGAYLRLSETEPSLSRIVGLFRDDVSGPEALIAFAWGCHDGDHAHYDAAGSVRLPDLKVPLAYPLLWDLMRWARVGGAPWFDLGGVTLGSAGGDDPLGGISDFKRWFSKELAQVGEEWEIEISPVRAGLARVVSSAATLARRARPR